MITILTISIIIIAPVLYNILIPLKPPRLDDYFISGQSFSSKVEGITQTIIKQVGDKVYSELTLEPGSAGPPEHMHISFDETATISKGKLTVKLNNEVVELSPGDRINFRKRQYHTFSNKSNSVVVITSEKDSDHVPAYFAYALTHMYPLLDSGSKLKMIHIFFKMSMFGNLFDSYIIDVPLNAQKIIKKILRPYARVLGYKLYNNKSKPRK